MNRKGLVQIYTGDGKGKTTAALGLACRARGSGMEVCYVSFFKDNKKWEYGEHRSLKKLGVKIYEYAKKHPRFYRSVKSDTVRKECLRGIKFIKKIFAEKKCDLLILDEINVALKDGFLKEKEVLSILDSKPKKTELILTGRGASKKIIEMADLVSKIRNVKHPFEKGIKARRGIEY